INNSPYYRTLAEIKEDLLLAVENEDWEEKQRLNLHLLWLNTIKEIEQNNSFNINKKEEDYLSELTRSDIKLLSGTWKLDGVYEYPFARSILAGFGKCLEENVRNDYNLDSILPYSKDIIHKTFDFCNEYILYD